MLVNNYREPLRRRPVGAQRLLRFRLVNREYWLFHGRPRHIASNQSPSAFCESRDSLPLDHTRTKGWRTWELVRLFNRVTLAAISFAFGRRFGSGCVLRAASVSISRS